MIRISITERDSFGSENVILDRTVQTESTKQLTRGRALRILKREYPELGASPPLVKRGPGFVTSKAIKPSPNCSYHFVWRDYYIVED